MRTGCRYFTRPPKPFVQLGFAQALDDDNSVGTLPFGPGQHYFGRVDHELHPDFSKSDSASRERHTLSFPPDLRPCPSLQLGAEAPKEEVFFTLDTAGLGLSPDLDSGKVV